jgi:hypothetical protein
MKLWKVMAAILLISVSLSIYMPVSSYAVTMDMPGELLPWSEVQNLIPRQSKFQVLDPETGLVFSVQRRAGSSHADVQPLTKKDTEIMKQIYAGKWSWERRAVIVVTEHNERIAGSMHGMPHGGDGIPGNAFKGHFCIHFLGSTTHKSGQTDPGHQWMVHKAAGRIESYAASLSPDGLIAAWIVALNQQDESMIKQIFSEDQQQAETLQRIVALMKTIDAARPLDTKNTISDDESIKEALTYEKQINIAIQRKESRFRNAACLFRFARATANQPWRLQHFEIK